MPTRRGVHRRPSRMVAAGVLALAMTAVAVSVAVVGPTATADTNPSHGPGRYNGEDLIRGLFFGVGPVAERHPKLVLIEIDETPENLDVIAAAIAAAESQNRGFLEGFGAAMYGGDPTRIAEVTLETAGRLLRAAEVGTLGSGGFAGIITELLSKLLPEPNADGQVPVQNGKPNAAAALQLWATAVARTLAPAE